jgi:hypothetical protein
VTRYNLLIAVVVVWASLLVPRAVHAAESYDNCTGFITSVPATISSQGTWCLKQDLSTANVAGSAITVNANNVTIDCNNFKLDGSAAGTGTATNGIYTLDHFNTTVRQCNIKGFFAGMRLESNTAASGGGHVVEDNRLEGNTFYGVFVVGDGSVVRRNRVVTTGGSTFLAYAYGMYLGYSVNVFDNIVAGVAARSGGNGWAYGIFTLGSVSTRVIGNSVRGVMADGPGIAHGISNQSDDHLVIRGNDLAGNAAAGSRGIYCGSATDSARDNVISGFATSIVLCTDSGGNDVVP